MNTGPLSRAAMPVPVGILGTASYDLPVEANTWVETELNFFLGDRRDVMARWMTRADFYQGFVESVFREEGIPTDLLHLGMIESGYLPTALSGAGAAGIWQFMPGTGRDMKLRVDNIVDERMDPVRSTRAAAQYLKSLYRVYGDWALAAAAYNAGSGRISRGMERYGARGFWDLAARGDLAEETRQYVPRLYAATIVSRNRERFGFEASRGLDSFAFDSIRVELALPITELAVMSGVDDSILTTMNPHLRRGETPQGGYWVWVPRGRGESAQRAYIAAVAERARLASYTVRSGDSLSRIAERSGVPAAEIRRINHTVNFDRLLAGAKIDLPAAGVQRIERENSERAASASPPPPRVTEAPAESRPIALSAVTRSSSGSSTSAPRIHTVGRGDTLSDLAIRYGVTVAQIREANSLRGTVIQLGQRLTIPPVKGAEPEVVVHVVVPGDNLSRIAEKYGSTVRAIQEMNSLGSGPIIPGQRLSVPILQR
ncbi:MAG: LysM peptidoglycan-binding domain-containing protein [Gemmatimonadota bacterium]|nr:LysM peptidoglycan-binding domain-containing protein [Gemmatimonadota bacterium]